MKLLLDDEFAPITRYIGFVKADCDSLVNTYLRWKAEGIGTKNIVYHRRQVNGAIRDVLLSLLPLQQFRQRTIFVPTAGPWTACFENDWKGADIPSTVSPLSTKLKCPTVAVLSEPHTIRGEKKDFGRWGGMVIRLYTPDATELRNLRRSVGVVNQDGRWKFMSAGEPLPFERADTYQAARTSDRFNEDMFHEYLKALELFPFDEGFYMPLAKGPAILLDSTRPKSTIETYSLQDVKQYT